MKRLRYADVYNGAYKRSVVVRCSNLSEFVERTLKRFRKNPVHHVAVPRYVKTLLHTQSIATRHLPESCNSLQWALAVTRFIERRAARLIAATFLHYMYCPSGPWLRRQLCQLQGSGFLQA